MSNERNLVPGWLQVAFGAALGAVAIAAVRVDIINNYAYGLATGGPELATVLVIAALCVVLVPSTAAIFGWSTLQAAITGICVLLTCWAALNAYADKFGSEILAKTAMATAYADAEKDKEAARATLARIAETADADTLEKLADAARKKADGLRAADTKKMGTDSCFKTCQAAEVEHTKVLARLADAKARDAAKAALSQARQEAKTGPAEASALATMLASRTGDNPAAIARQITLAVTVLGILVTQGVALLAHLSTTLTASGLRRMFPPRDEEAAAVQPAMQTDSVPTPTNATISEADALRFMIEQIMRAPKRQLQTSAAALAMQAGVKKSTFASWVKKWKEAGKIIASTSGNKTTFTMPKAALVRKFA